MADKKVEIEEDYNRFVVRIYSWNWFYWKFEGEKQFLKEDYDDARYSALQYLRDCLLAMRNIGEWSVEVTIPFE